jgi:hypothetical protein
MNGDVFFFAEFVVERKDLLDFVVAFRAEEKFFVVVAEEPFWRQMMTL